jgi:hypothetical protein
MIGSGSRLDVEKGLVTVAEDKLRNDFWLGISIRQSQVLVVAQQLPPRVEPE